MSDLCHDEICCMEKIIMVANKSGQLIYIDHAIDIDVKWMFISADILNDVFGHIAAAIIFSPTIGTNQKYSLD